MWGKQKLPGASSFQGWQHDLISQGESSECPECEPLPAMHAEASGWASALVEWIQGELSRHQQYPQNSSVFPNH